MTESSPELDGYEPGDGRPLASRRMLRPARYLIVLGILGLVLPSILVTTSTATNTADRSCSIVVARDAPFATGFDARFELVGPDGPSWYCYAQVRDDDDFRVASLGLIPGSPPAPDPGIINT
ncbi:hypothetical protein IWX78_000002 [Mycetocola sp. CAN_C7]|uniref:hypothetical protein n=1 Tax=Mycetocola sp. CAN_C7 TaxID=2787724 RepID=UPI0018CA67B2